ncbi:MAG: Alpha-agarase [Marine Group II euryarchaeote MED-G33]|nr:MAG: Alpha-agarase [Marine Group II euryarchaeote MED-G33]
MIVASLLAMSWSITIPAQASESKGSEGASILFEQRIFSSSEPLEATIGLWGLTLGRNYEMYWTVHATNETSEMGFNTTVSSGIIPFLATQNAMQFEYSEHHISNESMMYYLEITLNSSTGWTDVSVAEPFSVFWESMSPQYTNLFIFGDSLSDSGNTYSAFGTPESPPYWQGRYSNGQNWADFSTDWLGISNINGRGAASGNNRAFGGAGTGNGMSFFVIENIGKQVDDWDQNYDLVAGDVAAIWGGGNDLLNFGETNAQRIVDDIEEHAEQLIATGGQEIIFFELPPLEKTPGERDSSEQDQQELGQRVTEFNSGLRTMAAGLNSTYAVTTHVIPIWIGFEMLYYSGEHFGITNVTHPACDHDGATCDSNDPIAPNVEEYIFFDNLHPTETTHRAISLFLHHIIGIPDYDGDSVADQIDVCPHTLPDSLVGADGCEIPPPDTDEDGVIDDEDVCPNTDPGLTVDGDGCAMNQIDSDQDGVMDDVDQCPYTQLGWEVNSIGCSAWELDGDDDGIVDAEDDCPDTNVGDNIDGDGCADNQLDSDNDGVTDDLDACPNTPREELVNVIGCSESQLDDDADGIYNIDDACPNTPFGEMDVNTNGCGPSERDSDGDGTNDDTDQCPDTEWLAETNEDGCAANQRDTDGDGRKDSVDGCPLIRGSLNGCPILSIELGLAEAPDSDSRTANISIEIRCESNCEMNWILQEGELIVSEGMGAANGTYYQSYTNMEDESQQLSARVSIDGMWKDAVMTVYFPPFEDVSDNSENQSGAIENDDEGDSDSAGEQGSTFGMDSGSIAMIAMLLLINVGVVAAIMAVRSKSRQQNDGREKAMADFERDLFSEPSPVMKPPSMSEVTTPIEMESELEPPVETIVQDLPNIGDLLD